MYVVIAKHFFCQYHDSVLHAEASTTGDIAFWSVYKIL
ncbi:hypothetical protein APH_1356 [Anaplasma phagocytophilum str. HZ]|uniref:Uncharacterized protein n=1 Tax=Anaplasma phagocytophilum (strain HZ) TaxID=212042 RepID=Q2GIE5_ANAPZ|nr:hypothetical protein APH_1356 [Anaplasma phagocytophilum str. HZ]